MGDRYDAVLDGDDAKGVLPADFPGGFLGPFELALHGEGKLNRAVRAGTRRCLRERPHLEARPVDGPVADVRPPVDLPEHEAARAQQALDVAHPDRMKHAGVLGALPEGLVEDDRPARVVAEAAGDESGDLLRATRGWANRQPSPGGLQSGLDPTRDLCRRRRSVESLQQEPLVGEAVFEESCRLYIGFHGQILRRPVEQGMNPLFPIKYLPRGSCFAATQGAY